jgi:hypothetical protein
MKRRLFILTVILMALIIMGCQYLPYLLEFLPDIIPDFPLPIPTATPSTETAQPTFTLQPTATLAISTATLVPPTATLEPPTPTSEETATQDPISPTPLPSVEFVLQPGTPIYLSNFNQPDAGCDWMGVAGQVFDRSGNEIQGLTILSGELTSITGEAQGYGPGGYEILISNTPVDSTATYWVQVLGENNQPLSERVYFDTFASCEMNLVLINFVPLEASLTPTPTPTLEAYP